MPSLPMVEPSTVPPSCSTTIDDSTAEQGKWTHRGGTPASATTVPSGGETNSICPTIRPKSSGGRRSRMWLR